MIKIKLTYFITLIVFLSSCTQDRFNGEWTYSDKVELSFLDKNEFKWNNINNNFDFFGNYIVKPDYDSLILNTQHDFSLPFKFQWKNNSLILWNYKKNSGITKGHIDEIYIFNKKVKEKPYENIDLNKEIFKLPANYIGNIFINYNQKGSGNNLFDSENNRIITVSNNGLVKTEFEESILKFAFGSFEFECPLKKYPFFIDDAIKDSAIINLNKDSVYVCVYGYNQIGRKKINQVYGKEIFGNVLMLRVDTLKNILKTIDKY